MTEISAEKVKELREKSGAGFMDCKRALSATQGDLDAATDLLRKEGVVKAAKKAGRATSEGLIALETGTEGSAILEVNCETDFVARTDQFQEFINSVANLIVQKKPENLETLLTQSFGTSTLQQSLSELIARIGENIVLKRFRRVEAVSGKEQVGSYVHAGSKIGVILKVKLAGGSLEDSLLRDIAMHVAAMNPPYIRREDVPSSVVEREKEILRAQPELASKPANMIDKILEGKINRFYSDTCLNEQLFIKDPTGKKSVGAFLKEVSPGTELVEVIRFQVGEEVS